MEKDRSGSNARPGTEKIGLLGGTFDPVHQGHLAIAETARKTLSLDSVLFIPAASPPHKTNHQISPLFHRLAMLQIALQNKTCLTISTIEAQRPGVSYTIDTLRELRNSQWMAATFFLIIGLDAFLDLPTWKDCNQLTTQTNLVIVPRPGWDQERIATIIERCFPDYSRTSDKNVWISKDKRGIYFLACQPVPLSSRSIRLLVKEGESILGLVPKGVELYIKKHGLYT